MTLILNHYLCPIPNTNIRINISFQIYFNRCIELAIALDMSIVYMVRLSHEFFNDN